MSDFQNLTAGDDERRVTPQPTVVPVNRIIEETEKEVDEENQVEGKQAAAEQAQPPQEEPAIAVPSENMYPLDRGPQSRGMSEPAAGWVAAEEITNEAEEPGPAASSPWVAVTDGIEFARQDAAAASLARYFDRVKAAGQELNGMQAIQAARMMSQLTGAPVQSVMDNFDNLAAELVGDHFKDNALEILSDSWEYGNIQREIGEIGYNLRHGYGDIEAQERRLQELYSVTPDIPFHRLNFFMKGMSRVTTMASQLLVPNMITGATGGMAAAAGAAAIGMLSGVAIPAAIIGGMYAVGQRAATMQRNRQYFTGMNYVKFRDMTDAEGNRIDPELAKRMADWAGLLEGSLELVQFSRLPGFRRIAKRLAGDTIQDMAFYGLNDTVVSMGRNAPAGTLAGVLFRGTAKMGVDTVEEVAVEGLQELSNIFVDQLGRNIANDREGMRFDPIARDEALGRLREATVEQIGTFGILSVGGGAIEIAQDVRSNNDMIKYNRTAAGKRQQLEEREEFVANLPDTDEGLRELLGEQYTELQSVMDRMNKGEEIAPEEGLDVLRIQERIDIIENEWRRRQGVEDESVRPIPARAPDNIEQAQEYVELNKTLLDPELRQEIRETFRGVSDQQIDASLMLMNLPLVREGTDINTFLRDKVGFTRDTHEMASLAGVKERTLRRSRGFTQFVENGQAIIYASKKADVSTFIHELAHVARRNTTGKMLTQLEETFGVENGVWTVQQEEAFAYSVEEAIRWNQFEGDVSQEAQGLIGMIGDWIKRIYHSIRQRWNLKPEVRRAMSAYFGFTEVDSKQTDPAIYTDADGNMATKLTGESYAALNPDGSAALQMHYYTDDLGTVHIEGLDVQNGDYAGQLRQFVENFLMEVEGSNFDLTFADDATKGLVRRAMKELDIEPRSEMASDAVAQGLTQAVSLRTGEETLEKYGLVVGGQNLTREVGRALGERQQEKYGKIERDDTSDEAAEKISEHMVEDLLYELRPDRFEESGAGWYSEKFQRALDTLGELFPEIKTDENARHVMTMLIAVTSDGQQVTVNTNNAVKAYEYYREHGELPVNEGAAYRSTALNFRRINQLLKTMELSEIKDYLLQEATVKDLQNIAKEMGVSFSTSYKVDVVLPMSAVVFGPKLGAFYANLMGSHGYLTMDLWWSRTFNRYRGTMLPETIGWSGDEVTSTNKFKGVAAFKAAYLQEHGTDAQRKALKALEWAPDGSIKTPATKEMITAVRRMKDETAVEKIVEAQAAAQAKEFKGTTLIEKKGNTLHKLLFVKLQDRPFNASDRSFMIQTVEKAREKLAKKGHDISLADIQAILWYYEKRLYGELGAKQSADISYEEAAAAVVESRGPDGDGTVDESPLDDDAGGPDGADPKGSSSAAEQVFQRAGGLGGIDELYATEVADLVPIPEGADSDTSSTTQVATTSGTYIKALDMALGIHPEAKRVLDYGAGLGLGTDAMREQFPDLFVDSYEPFNARWKGLEPTTFTRPEKINKRYDVVIVPNVLNVLPEDIRRRVAVHISRLLANGGVAIISTRGWKGDVANAKNSTPAGEDHAVLVQRKSSGAMVDVFQRGFDGNELMEWLEGNLSEDYVVEPTPRKIGGNSVVVRRAQPSGLRSGAERAAPSSLAQTMIGYRGDQNYLRDFAASENPMPGDDIGYGWGVLVADDPVTAAKLAKQATSAAVKVQGLSKVKSDAVRQILRQLSGGAAKALRINSNGRIMTDRGIDLTVMEWRSLEEQQNISDDQKARVKSDIALLEDLKKQLQSAEVRPAVARISLFKGKKSEDYTMLTATDQLRGEDARLLADKLEEAGSPVSAQEMRDRRAKGDLTVHEAYQIMARGLSDLTRDERSGAQRASMMMLTTGYDGIAFPAEKKKLIFDETQLSTEVMRLLQEDKNEQADAMAIAVDRGNFVPMEDLAELKEEPWAEEEAFHREVLALDALNYADKDEFVVAMLDAENGLWDEDYYAEVWDEAKVLRNELRRKDIDGRFVKALDVETLQLILSELSHMQLDNELPYVVRGVVEKYRNSQRVTKKETAEVLRVLKKDTTKFRKVVEHHLPADHEARVMLGEAEAALMTEQVESKLEAPKETTADRLRGQIQRLRSKLKVAEKRLSEAKKENRADRREMAEAVSAIKSELRQKYKHKARVSQLIKQIMRKPSRATDYEYVKKIWDVQNRYIARPSQRMRVIREMLRKAKYSGDNSTMNEILKLELDRIDMQKMSVGELEGIAKEVKQLRDKGREVYRTRAAEMTEKVHNVRARMREVLGTGDVELKGKGSAEAKKILSDSFGTKVDFNTLRPERIARLLDGNQQDIFYDWLWTQVNDATNSFLEGLNRRVEAGDQKMKELGIRPRHLGKQVTVDGMTYTVDQIIHMYIAKQNDDSREALRWGNQIPDATRDKFIATLTEEQKEWGDWMIDSFDEEFDRLNEVFIQDNNFGMQKVLRYFPMLRTEINDQPLHEQVAQEILARAGFRSAKVPQGFTKARVTISPKHQTPIRLGATAIWQQQVAKQEHYITHGVLIRQLNRIFNSRQLREAIAIKHGATANDWIDKYLNDVALPNYYAVYDSLRAVSNFLRQNVALSALAFNAVTAFKQIPSVALFLPYAGPIQMLSSLVRFASNPVGFIRRVKEMDPQVRNRAHSRLLEEIKQMQSDSAIRGLRDQVARAGMIMIRAMDMFAVAVGWDATYNNAKAKGASDAEARSAAQTAMLRSQPAGRAKDLPQIYRQDGAYKWFLMFTNQLNQNWNLITYDMFRGGHENQLLHGISIAFSLAMAALVIGAVNRRDVPDEPQELGADLFTGLLSAVPFLGNPIRLGVEGLGFFAGVEPFEAATTFGEALREITDQDGDWEADMKAVGRTLVDTMSTFGVPGVHPIRRTLRAAQEQAEQDDPFGAEEVLKILLGGEPKE